MNEIETNEITERDNLAMIAIVDRTELIPNKDKIELVYLKDCGYTFICEKGHQPGDYVVYVKYDTVVPDNSLFTFMKESKFRVKSKSFTEKDEFDNVVKKIYSQGLIISFDKFKHYIDTETDFCDVLEAAGFESSVYTWYPGEDVTKLLEIRKYIPPVNGSMGSLGAMQSKGDFPTNKVNKTDEINLASRTKALEEIKGMKVYITQKLEGSSLTAYYDENGEFCVCSRNNMLKDNDNKFWQGVNNSGLREKLKNIPGIIVQAELCGPGVQKNKLGLFEPKVFVFNMVRESNRQLLSYPEMTALAKEHNIELVPIICEINSFDWDFDKLQMYADIQKYKVEDPNMNCLGGVDAEGIVVRPYFPFRSYVLKTDWSAKIINRNYKL